MDDHFIEAAPSPVDEAAQRAAIEARLHAAVVARAARTETPGVVDPGLFRSFYMGGFECSTHRRRDGVALDLLGSTRHREFAAADYAALARHGVRTVRDGIDWRRIETEPGRYDWSSALPMLRAAAATGTQAIWDVCHWGWPDGLDIWSEDFAPRFAAFAGAFARLVRDETDAPPVYVAINEISFWAWAGGSLGFIHPLATERGDALKAILARAAIQGVAAIRAADPRARVLSAEPAIHVRPRSDAPEDVAAARGYAMSQHEALDMLLGRVRPELGGREDLIDVVGLNYYLHNQWTDGGPPLAVDDPGHRPFREILAEAHARTGKPVVVTETGIEGPTRPAWLRVIAAEVTAAQAAGAQVAGICLYPVTDYPGWDDDRHCPTGLLGYADDAGLRPVDAPLAAELARLVAAVRPA